MRTLLVSDDESTLEALGRILTMCHMTCEMCLLKDMPSRTLLQNTTHCDFIILDYMEFSPDGLDLLLSMRKKKQRKPIIIITNSRAYMESSTLVNNHAVYLLRKPINITKLMQAIESVMDPNQCSKLNRTASPTFSLEN